MTARALVVGLLWLAVASAVPAVAVPEGAEVVSTIPFSGHVDAEAGLRPPALVRAVGPLHVDGDQEGIFEVPGGATSLTVDVGPTRRLPSETTLRLSLCDGACSPTATLLAVVEGRESLAAVVHDLGTDAVGWELRVGHGAAFDTPFDGDARFWRSAGSTAAAGNAVPSGADATWPHAPPTLLITVIAVVAAAGFLVVDGLRRAATGAPWLLAGLYHRIGQRDLLDHDVRQRIHDVVGERPGIHFGELARRTATARGTLDHHVRQLVKGGLLVEHATAGSRCFFRPEHALPHLVHAADVTRSPTARGLLAAIAERPGSNVAEIARNMNVRASTISYHVARLAARGLVQKAPVGTAVRLDLTSAGRSLLDVASRRAGGERTSSKNPPSSS